MKRIGILFAAFFPVLGLLLWWGQLSFFAISGVIVEFKVEGFDPRDLLAGHYLQYRVNYGEQPVCADGIEENRCVCIDRGGEQAEATWSGSCESRPSCDLWLSGRCQYGRFTSGIERYYIPEEYSQLLAIAPANSSILVAINSGKGIVVDYRVDDKSLLEYAREKSDELSQQNQADDK